jgi:hypothetical protein
MLTMLTYIGRKYKYHKEIIQLLLQASKEVGLELNAEETNDMIVRTQS